MDIDALLVRGRDREGAGKVATEVEDELGRRTEVVRAGDGGDGLRVVAGMTDRQCRARFYEPQVQSVGFVEAINRFGRSCAVAPDVHDLILVKQIHRGADAGTREIREFVTCAAQDHGIRDGGAVADVGADLQRCEIRAGVENDAVVGQVDVLDIGDAGPERDRLPVLIERIDLQRRVAGGSALDGRRRHLGRRRVHRQVRGIGAHDHRVRVAGIDRRALQVHLVVRAVDEERQRRARGVEDVLVLAVHRDIGDPAQRLGQAEVERTGADQLHLALVAGDRVAIAERIRAGDDRRTGSKGRKVDAVLAGGQHRHGGRGTRVDQIDAAWRAARAVRDDLKRRAVVPAAPRISVQVESEGKRVPRRVVAGDHHRPRGSVIRGRGRSVVRELPERNHVVRGKVVKVFAAAQDGAR